LQALGKWDLRHWGWEKLLLSRNEDLAKLDLNWEIGFLKKLEMEEEEKYQEGLGR